jgi:hypothetical protein
VVVLDSVGGGGGGGLVVVEETAEGLTMDRQLFRIIPANNRVEFKHAAVGSTKTNAVLVKEFNVVPGVFTRVLYAKLQVIGEVCLNGQTALDETGQIEFFDKANQNIGTLPLGVNGRVFAAEDQAGSAGGTTVGPVWSTYNLALRSPYIGLNDFNNNLTANGYGWPDDTITLSYQGAANTDPATVGTQVIVPCFRVVLDCVRVRFTYGKLFTPGTNNSLKSFTSFFGVLSKPVPV